MKHAINELTAILESLRTNQKIDPSMERHERIVGIEMGIAVLQSVYSGDWELKMTDKNPYNENVEPSEKGEIVPATAFYYDNPILDESKRLSCLLEPDQEPREKVDREEAFSKFEENWEDLGELDTSKACSLENPECESCQ